MRRRGQALRSRKQRFLRTGCGKFLKQGSTSVMRKHGSLLSIEVCSARRSCRTFKVDCRLIDRFKRTGSALLDAPFSDGGRAGTKPSGFELLRPRPRPFRKASPARREGSQTTTRARLCPISVRIRELSYSSSLDHAVIKGPIQAQHTGLGGIIRA